MNLGFIGLGRMGGNMVERLIRGGHHVWAYDPQSPAVERVASVGATGDNSLPALIQSLPAPRAVWLMIPAGNPVDQTIELLLPLLQQGDTIIDGGNSNYKDSQRRAASTAAKGIHFVDVGTSGGIWGLKEGYSMMIGGPKPAV